MPDKPSQLCVVHDDQQYNELLRSLREFTEAARSEAPSVVPLPRTRSRTR